MNPLINTITLSALSFLLGSIPVGFIVGRLKGIDLREHGSKNIGATNTLRVLGKGPGIAVLILDAMKGFLPVTAAKWMQLPSGWFVAAGMSAMLGHIFSPFLKFKGGKGVATGLGVAIGLSPLVSAIAVIVFVLTVWLTRYVSLGSILGAATMAFLFFVLPSHLLTGDPLPYRIFGTVAASFILYRHKENIKRILNGTESRFGEKK
jgi:glycerol-3-phosphate acyltransferase PlsY